MKHSDNQLQSKIRKTHAYTKGRFNLDKLLYPPRFDWIITTFPALPGQYPPLRSKKWFIHQRMRKLFAFNSPPNGILFKWST
jgi:hypothetical protein